IQQILCRLGHRNTLWEQVGFDNKLHTRGGKYLFFCFSDAQMHREMEEMNTKFHKNKSKIIINKGYQAHIQTFSPGGTIMFHRSDISDDSDSNFVGLIHKYCPNVIKEMAQKEKFDTSPKFSQDAYIYKSDLLPDWIKAMRDASLASL